MRPSKSFEIAATLTDLGAHCPTENRPAVQCQQLIRHFNRPPIRHTKNPPTFEGERAVVWVGSCADAWCALDRPP